jgi:conjugative transposon TraJ protein
VFGLAVFDGFQHTLTSWFARYLNVYLWLPVANIFGTIIGKVQQKMIELDISQIQTDGDTFFSSTDIAYLVFLIIGIVGYFTVPSVANYIIHAGGAGATVQKVTNMVNAGGNAVAGRTAETAGHVGRTPQYINEGYHEKDRMGGGYMADKLSGKS